MKHLLPLALLAVLGCDSGIAPSGAPVTVVRGALIDGSEDGARPGAGEVASPATLDGNGALRITFKRLSLEGYDVDTMLDFLLFPEEFEGEEIPELDLPERITSLADREVSIVGYMIPGETTEGRVGDFMLVRDLASCCFGGSPLPDEWIDVVMVEGRSAEYHPFLPMRARGVLRIGGEQDEVGFAIGIYRLEAVEVGVEE